MQFLEEQQRIRSSLLIERDTIKKELRNYPEGKLMLVSDHGSIKKYFINEKDGDANSGYYKKGIGRDTQLVHRLARKAYLEEHLRRVNSCIDMIDKTIRELMSLGKTEIIRALPRHFDLLPEEMLLTSAVRKSVSSGPNPSLDPSVPVRKVRLWIKDMTVSEWAAQVYRQNGKCLESKRITLANGLKVRSKSEASILELFARFGLAYHYDELVAFYAPSGYDDMKENGFMLWSGTAAPKDNPSGQYVLLSPDTILPRSDGKLIYHEHVGMINDPDYLDDLQIKLAVYKSNGIVPWDNLILTFDDPEGGIDLQLVEAQLRSKGLI